MLRNNSIYATFPTIDEAERAAGALLDHGVRPTALSFIVPNERDRTPIDAGTPYMPGAPRPYQAADHSTVPTPYLNPMASAPTALIDLNSGARVGEDASVDHRAGYRYDALGAQIPDRTGRVPTTYMPYQDQDPNDHIPINTPLRASPDIVGTDILTIAGDASMDAIHADHLHIIDQQRTEPHAASGITTTTAGDAARGALGGAGIGIGLGTLLGIAAVMVPGIGWVAGAGALVAGLAAATGAAGAVAGGAYGFLADLGLPADQTHRLQTHLEEGGPLLSIAMVDGLTDIEVVEILQKYGATSAQAY